MHSGNVDETAIDLILIDGRCVSCHAIVRHIHKRDHDRVFYYASQQSPLGQQLLDTYQLRHWEDQSIIYLQKGRAHTLSTAVLRIYAQLPRPFCWVRGLTMLPRWLRDRLYLLYARNRHRLFGKLEACEIPEPELRKRFLD